jgi:5'-nucleotidase
MTKPTIPRLIIGISSRALFDLTEANSIFETQGVNAYSDYQVQHENEILEPGVAFHLVQKLLKINTETQWIEVILLSRNSADTGLRVFNSIKHYGLNITRAVFSGGANIVEYAQAFGAHLFLSANPEDVKHLLKMGCAAALLWPSSTHDPHPDLLKIAFDGDAVLFDSSSEEIFRTQGLEAFHHNEIVASQEPLPGGPFRGFLAALHQLQQQFPPESCPIRTALVTARQAPAHERVIRTLREWNIRIDEAFFLGGLNKSQFLQAFHADIFFDDQDHHCQSASLHVTTGQVPS